MTESNVQPEPAPRKAKLIKLAVDVVEGVHAMVRALEELERFIGDGKAMRPLSKEMLVFYGLCETMIGELSAPGGGVAAIEKLARDLGAGAKVRTLPTNKGGMRDNPNWLVSNTNHLFDSFRSMSQKEAAFRATLTDRRASQALTNLRSAMDRTLMRLDLLRCELAGTGVDVRILEKLAARRR